MMPTPPARMKKCPYCAEDILEESVFCTFCGKSLTKSRNPRPIANGFDIISLAATLILGIAVFFLPIWPDPVMDIIRIVLGDGATVDEAAAIVPSEYLLGQLQSHPIHILIVYYTRFLIPIVAIASIVLIIFTFLKIMQGKNTSGIWLIVLGVVLIIRPLIYLTSDEGSITSIWIILVLAVVLIFIVAGFGKIFMGESPINPNALSTLPEQILPKPSRKKSNNLVPVLVVGSVLFIGLAGLLVVVFLILSKTGLSGQLQQLTIIAPQPTMIVTVSPGKSYSDQMVPILSQLRSESTAWVQFGAILTSTDPAGTGLTYVNELPSLGQMKPETVAYVENTLLPLAHKTASDGGNLLKDWNSISPPPELEIPHQEIAACIQFQIDSSNDVIALITQSQLPKAVDSNACSKMQGALSAIQTYVNNNR
jgi:hypothetical protein